MPLTAFGKFITSNSRDFPDSDQIAVGKYFVYVMQDPSRLQYADKKTLALKGTVSISISVTDDYMPGMVWWNHKIYLPDNSGNLYFFTTDPTTGILNTQLTKIATLSNFGGTQNQLGFDFGRKLLIYKKEAATTAYYIDMNNPSNMGVYATVSGTNFGGSIVCTNFFVDADGYMYLGIGDNPSIDVRILRPLGTNIPIQYVLDQNIKSTADGTGGIPCDGLYPDPYDETVIYTNNDDQTICMYSVIGRLSLKVPYEVKCLLSCDNSMSFRQYIIGVLVISTIS